MRWILAGTAIVMASIGLGGCYQNAIIITPSETALTQPSPPPPK